MFVTGQCYFLSGDYLNILADISKVMFTMFHDDRYKYFVVLEIISDVVEVTMCISKKVALFVLPPIIFPNCTLFLDLEIMRVLDAILRVVASRIL
jgi:hypothetical protein